MALESLKNRKLLVVLIVIAATVVLTALGKLDSGTYERTIVWVTALFFGANVASKWAPTTPPTDSNVSS